MDADKEPVAGDPGEAVQCIRLQILCTSLRNSCTLNVSETFRFPPGAFANIRGASGERFGTFAWRSESFEPRSECLKPRSE